MLRFGVQMNRNLQIAFGLALITLSTNSALAADVFSTSNGDTHSAVKDSSTMGYTSTNYGVRLEHAAADPNLFINSVTITGGAGWDPNIDLSVSTAYIGNTNGTFEQNTYTLGTAISADVNWDFDVMANRSGTIASSVATGFYDFTVDIKGGASNSANGLLASFGFHMEVVNTITAQASTTMSPPSVGYEQTSHANVTFQNTGSRVFKTTTWYISAFSLNGANTDYLTFEDFEGNWFDQVLAPGASITGQHSKWKATSANAIGNYQGDIGIYGGLYKGDNHSWRASGTNLQVVPEPASMTILAAGLAFIARRRKSA